MFSGTTCVSVVIQNNSLVCANLGDSRAVLGILNEAEIWECVDLSRDHKPD